MPTYEYRCKSCGEHLEVVQSFKDDALTTCPACGGTLRKVFGSIGIAFKGSGFYKTDSRSTSSARGQVGFAGRRVVDIDVLVGVPVHFVGVQVGISIGVFFFAGDVIGCEARDTRRRCGLLTARPALI